MRKFEVAKGFEDRGVVLPQRKTAKSAGYDIVALTDEDVYVHPGMSVNLETGVKACMEDDEVMLITTEGIIIRIEVSDTSLLGRVTSGVKLINVNDGVTVASMAKVKEDKSIMENDIPEPKQPEGVIVEEDEDASASEEELISKELGELINRAEQDSEEE